jgi:methionyl-tRNA synthetase
MEYIQADIWVRHQRMRGHEVHFVGADDAHGAPIMIAAEKAGMSPQEFVARIAGGRQKYLDGFLIRFDHWHSTDSPENTELSQDIYRKLKAAGLIVHEAGRAVLRSGEGHVPARPLHQGRVPEVRRAGPVRRRLRGLQLGLRTDRPEESVLGAVRRDAGAADLRALLLPALGPALRRLPRGWTQDGRLQQEVANKAREWLTVDGDKALGDWDISRDAPYFGIPIPDAPGKYFYVWLDAPVGYLASFKAYCARAGATSKRSCRTRAPSRCTSSARTSSTSTRCSGRRC